MENEFINVTEFRTNINYINDTDHGMENSIYQVQPEDYSNNAVIMKVGNFKKTSDVLINKFNISPSVHCIIVSSIHDNNDLIKMSNHSNFEMIKIIINYSNTNKLYPICYIKLLFHTTENINNNTISKYLSTNDKKIKLNGYFSISFHSNEGVTILENFKEYKKTSDMISKMIYYLTTNKIRNIIHDMTKKNLK